MSDKHISKEVWNKMINSTIEGDVFPAEEDITKMNKKDLMAYIKKNHKIKEVLPFIANNPKIAKTLGMDVEGYRGWEKHFDELKSKDTSNRMYNTQYNEQRMQRIYDLGFGQDSDSVTFVDSSINFLGASGTESGQYPGYTGYFDPKAWGKK